MDDASRVGKKEEYGDFTFLGQGIKGGGKGQCASVEDMHAEAIEMTRKVLESTAADGMDFIPVAFIYSPLDETAVTVAMLADGFQSRESKQKLGAALASFARTHKSAAIVLATDGWAVKEALKGATNMEEARREAERVRPAEHPDRVEVLSVNCIYPDGTCIGVLFEYKRHAREEECAPCKGTGQIGGLVKGADWRGIRMGQCRKCKGWGKYKTETIEWQEVNDGRGNKDHRTEQSIIPKWSEGGVS